jgi:phosphatidylserine/phosphatidylglycerophosphate/cardiolipin synthase-like enzyme
MMSRSLLLLVLLTCLGVQAQIPIAEARTHPIGTTVTVQGVVTNGSELGNIRYLQDATAGIAAFPGNGSVSGFGPSAGSNITITGTLKLYNGLLELDPIISFSINSTGNVLPEPIVLTTTQIGENHESMLVQVNDAVFNNGGEDLSSGTTDFSTTNGNGIIYLNSGHPMIGSSIPVGPVHVRGILSQYSTSMPASGGYQLLPRSQQDLIPASSIHFTTPLQQTNILPDGFTLSWNTNIGGNTGVFLGTTAALGFAEVIANNVTEHSIALTGLQPATFYYARAWSVNGTDTAFSATGLFSTASSVAGEIIVYFNKPVDVSVAAESEATYLGSAMEDTVIAYIDRALSTIDVAMYNTTLNSMVEALNDAVDRGVQVRYIAEGSTNNSALEDLPMFPVHYRVNSEGSGMHNKFLAIDADEAEDAVTITSSLNFTSTSYFYDANNMVIVKDQALTRAYRNEFEEMWGSQGPFPDDVNSRFGGQKTDNTPHLFNVNGTLVECSFSPGDGTEDRIRKALESADTRIEFALFAFTSNELMYTLIDMNVLPAVEVRGMLDDAEEGSWNMQQLQNASIPVLLDNVPNSNLHHKYAIVDRHSPEDPLVITGSHNWSFNAENLNDENTLIIHSSTVADHFYQEWAARWYNAVNVDDISGIPGLVIWPNPVIDRLWLETGNATDPMEVSILTTDGRCVASRPIASSVMVALDLSSLSAGIYLLSIRQDERSGNVRFMKQ